MKDTSFSDTSMCVCVCVLELLFNMLQCFLFFFYLFAPNAQVCRILVHKRLLVTPGIISTAVLYEFNELLNMCIDEN